MRLEFQLLHPAGEDVDRGGVFARRAPRLPVTFALSSVALALFARRVALPLAGACVFAEILANFRKF